MFSLLSTSRRTALNAGRRVILNRPQTTEIKTTSFLNRFLSDEGNQPIAGTPEWFDDVTKTNKITLFMKGTPDSPQCGFSRGVCQILDMHGVKVDKAVNVLEDNAVREGVKEYSDWPTIPQVYMGGEFIGGFDLMLELHQNGEILEEFEKIGVKSIVEEDYKNFTDENKNKPE